LWIKQEKECACTLFLDTIAILFEQVVVVILEDGIY